MDRLSTDVGTDSLTDYGAGLRRRWKVVLLGMLLGLAAGCALLALQSKHFTSTTSVLVQPAGTGSASLANGRTEGEINLDTESQLVSSAQVAEDARTLLRTEDSVFTLLDRVQVTVPPNSQVLSIAYTADTAKGAQEGSHAFAQAYLTSRATAAKAQVDLTVAGLQTQLKAAQKQLKTITDRLAGLVDGVPDQVYAEAQRNVVVSQIQDLTTRLAPLQSTPASPGEIITDAPLPRRPSSPIPALDLGGGLALGLLLGLAAALAVDRRDHRLRRPEDVERHVGVPVLADVPAERRGPGLPGDTQAPLFDRLRNSLVGFDPAVSPVQVCDPGGRGASGLVALQLARSLARVHGEATLVIAHGRSVLPAATGMEGLPGLVEVLRGQVNLSDACFESPSAPGVLVVPPGRDPEALEALLQSPDLSSVLAALRGSASGVVVETLGTGESAAAQAVAAQSAAVVLVAERGRTQGEVVSEAAVAAGRIGSPVAGVVLVAALGRRELAASPDGDTPAPVQSTAFPFDVDEPQDGQVGWSTNGSSAVDERASR